MSPIRDALIPFAILLSVAEAARPPPCNRICGSTTVPYPFGFSAGCGIYLNCNSSSGSPEIGGFLVRNFTSHTLLVDLPPVCDRPVATAIGLFGRNYAMTTRNGLLLRNCSSTAGKKLGCSISTELLSELFDRQSCGTRGDNISCFPGADSGGGGGGGGGGQFIVASRLSEAGCSSLFSAMEYETEYTSFPSLQIRTVELGWWLEGQCRCSQAANCTIFKSPANGAAAFQCRCKEGFEGDGFADGDGCRNATSAPCRASDYTSDSGGSTRVGVLVGGIIASVAIMAFIGLVIYISRRRSTSAPLRRATKRLLSGASFSVPLYSYKDIERATNGFSDTQRLGTGAYGTVYAGRLPNDKLVAIKKIKHREPESARQVMNEIKLLSSVCHPNLVRLLGCCIERGEQILVYEFMPNGTLSQHLQHERGDGLPWTVRLAIAAETAKAVAYLHSAVQPPILHRDIKSSNILLDYNFQSKLADFGLSRIGMVDSSHISTAPQGTPGYVDPQYHQNFHLSDKSDVYSFGVVLVEIITAMKVVDFSRVQGEVNLAALAIEKIGKGRVEEIIDPGLEPHRDAWTLSSIHKVAELAFRCLAFHRDMRPTMMEVADELEQIKLSGWSPSDEHVFMSSASSLCSSPSSSIKSAKKVMVVVNAVEEAEVDSPVSVQDRWCSHQSSPSANSLLGNARH